MEIITEFQKLASTDRVVRRGRPATLTPAQREHRHEVSKVKNRLRNEARRRAYVVLQTRYADEFNALMESEYEALKTDERYHIPTEEEFFATKGRVSSETDLSI